MRDDATPVQSLIAKWGKLSSFARDAGITYGAAKQMQRRSSIPVTYWPALLSSETAKSLGVTADHLMSIHAERVAA